MYRAVPTSTSPLIDFVNGTTYTLFTPNADFVITNIIVKPVTVTGFVLAGAFSIGTNSSSFNNAVAITSTGVGLIDNTVTLIPTIVLLTQPVVTAGTPIKIKITTALTATIFTGYVYINGLYV